MTETEARLVFLTFAGGTLLLFAWWLGAVGGQRRQRIAAERFAHRAGLPMPDAASDLARRVVRRHRFVLGGVAASLVATALWLEHLWIGGWYGGLAVGAVVDRLTQPVAPPGRPRVAHATSARVSDYVPRWLLVTVGLASVAAPVLAVLWLFALRPELDLGDVAGSGGPATPTLVPLAGVVGSLLLARLVVRQRTSAGSPLELATDDALRAQAVRDALHLSAATSVLAALAMADSLAQDTDGALRDAGGALPLFTLAMLTVVGTVHEVSGPRHWRARLHPELERAAAGSA